MTLAAKVWASDESEPEGLFHRETLPDCPPTWLWEEPAYAAELYGLERFKGPESCVYTVNVLDTKGELHRFEVRVARMPVATVKTL